MLASGGAQKLPIIRAALRAGLGHTLVVDEDTGESLLGPAEPGAV